MSLLILFVSFIVLLVFSVPIAVSLGISTLISIIYSGTSTFDMFVSSMISAVDSFPLLAVPFFILAGELMGKGGISRRIFGVANSLVGHQTGGFAMAAILTCMFFGSISGSSPATVAAVGGLMIPEMVKRGYDLKFSTGTVAAAGSLGVLIPPSIDMIMFGVTSNTSIGDLFIAGIVPGVLVGFSLMVWAYIYSKKMGYEKEHEKFSLINVFKELFNAKWAIIIPIIIIGGIYSGIFTPTEAAVTAVVIGFIISLFLYKEIGFKDLPDIILSASLTTSAIFFILASATAFGKLLTFEQAPAKIADLLLGFTTNPIIIILLINILLILVGTFMDSVVSIIILTPILFPIALELGFDPVHFGVIMILNLAIGFITPPIGVNLFVGSGISGLSVEQIAKAVIPYFIALLISLIIVITFPSLSLFLNNFFE